MSSQAASRRKLILDVDTGTDDAVAIMLAALHPALDLIACTTVNGNVEVEHGTDNTLRVLDYIGRPDIPVYQGLSRPLVRADFPIPRSVDDLAGKIHGKSLPLPAASQAKAATGAVEFLIETFRNATDEIVLVPVAPLTNIAAALALYPKLVDQVPEVAIMGGGHAIGNVTPSAESTSGPTRKRRPSSSPPAFKKSRWFRSTPRTARSSRARTARGCRRSAPPPGMRRRNSPFIASVRTTGCSGCRSPNLRPSTMRSASPR
jgi:Inosine-uridine preferring nucleoside hydrolase